MIALPLPGECRITELVIIDEYMGLTT